MDKILQDENIIQTQKTVDWMVNNTKVSVFDPIDFSGYQRKIDDRHCEKIVNYLNSSFYLPVAIICACDGSYYDDKELRIVDGQHRVQAFKRMKEENSHRYEEIREMEVPVIVLEDVPLEREIETFITINKTSKKVDTSLAYVLKNKINKGHLEEMSTSKAEYLAVEVAQEINQGDCIEWNNKILFEGNPKNTDQYISLNAFVKATRVLISTMAKKSIINLQWGDQCEVEHTIKASAGIVCWIWKQIYIKWPELKKGDSCNREILQGAIGYTAISRMIVQLIRDDDYVTTENLYEKIELWIDRLDVDYKKWQKGGEYSKYTSGSGYKLVADELISSIRYRY